MKVFLLPFIAIAALLLSSCDAVITQTPVADSTESPLQEKLEGTWYKDDRSMLIAFDSNGAGYVAGLEWRNDEFTISKAELNAVEVDGNYYLSMRSLDGGAPEGYMFTAFDLDKENEVRVYIPDLKKIETLITEGKVPGKVDKGRYSSTIHVDDVKLLIKEARPVEDYFRVEEKTILRRLSVDSKKD